MCCQTVCLVQAALEREGITTVSISLLREVTSQLKPPRALWVPFPMGYPLGEPKNPDLQHQIIAAALRLLARNDVPVLETFTVTNNKPNTR
ncbi:MAG: hypothetical protein SF097_02295 [Acidobacteriota bacterium]|nr:hypothetical protein [Acidobacteriota bacterium]